MFWRQRLVGPGGLRLEWFQTTIFRDSFDSIELMTFETLTPAQRNRGLAAIIGAAFGVGVAVGATMPLLSLSLERDGYSGFAIGALSAMLPLAVLCMGPLMPRFIARLGMPRSIFLGLGVAATAALLFPAIPNYYAWCAIRFLMGAASAIHWITSETWVNLMAGSRSRGRIMSTYAMVLAGGFVLGPLIVNLTGIDGWVPFLVVSASLALAMVPVALARDVAPTMVDHSRMGIGQALAIAPTVMIAALVAGFVDVALFALIPVYEMRAGFPSDVAAMTLSVFMAGNLILQLPVGWLADHTDRRAVLLGSVGVISVAAAVYPFLLGAEAWLWLMMFCWGGVSWGIYTLALGLMGERFPPHQLAAANSAFVMMYEVGSFFGPISAGSAMDRWPLYGMPFLIAAVSGALLLFGVVRAIRR